MDPYLILYFWSLQPGSGGHESTCTHVPFVALLYRYSSSRLIGLPPHQVYCTLFAESTTSTIAK
jgi:hypothetical protein